MRRTKTMLMGDLLEEFFKRPYIAAKVAEGKLPDTWREIVGDRAADRAGGAVGHDDLHGLQIVVGGVLEVLHGLHLVLHREVRRGALNACCQALFCGNTWVELLNTPLKPTFSQLAAS